MNPGLQRLFRQSVCLYVLFLIPTFILLAYAGQTDASISTHIGGTWQGLFWHFPGLNATGTRVVLDILTAIAVAGLGWLYFKGWRLLAGYPQAEGQFEQAQGQAEQRNLGRTVLIWAAVCGAVLLAVVPFHSSDVYGYLNRGFQQSLYHTNPYLTPVVNIPGWEHEPMFHAHWIYNPCPYGFFFAGLTAGLTALFGAHFLPALLAFKFLNWLLVLATTWLLLKMSQTLGHQRPWLAAFAFGANPLVLLHAVGNGHNDILMAFLLLSALALLGSKRQRWLSLPLLLLSVLVKYASLLAVPFVALYLLRKKDWQALLIGALVSLILLALMAAPYIDPHQAWPWADMLDNAGKPQHSVADMLARAVYYPLKWFHWPAQSMLDSLLRLLKPVFWGGFILFYARQLWTFARKEARLDTVIAETGMVMAVMVAFISAKFHPWYVVMFLPFLLLLPENNRWRQFGQTFSLFQLAGFTVFQNLPVISPLVLTILPAWLAFKRRSPFQTGQLESAEQ